VAFNKTLAPFGWSVDVPATFVFWNQAMARQLRIALVITELEVGGAERCLVNLAAGLDRDRFAVTVYCLAPRPRAPQDRLVRRLEDEQVPVHFLAFSNKWSLIAAVRSLRRLFDGQRPDVIQSMLFHANVVSGLAHRPGGPGVLSLGVRVADPSRWRQWVEARVARRAQRIVCVSQSVADFTARQVGIDRARLEVIPNGIDVLACLRRSPADLTRYGIAPGRRVITCISRLATQKGIDLLIRAAPNLFANLPDHDLLLVGDGPEAANLRRLAAERQVSARVHFAGWQPAVPEILLASDLMVLPSRWEGMPNVLLEAMACGCPVVCSAAEGVAEVLGPLAESQTAPVGNSQVLVRKALAIIRNPDLARQLGRQNQQRVTNLFSLAEMVRRYETLFETLSRPESTVK
jgi:glycosyltransferase involved in cell wall biosynthesis